MPARREQPPIERAARAICRFRGLPEDTRFEGAPMWHSVVPEALAALGAAVPREEMERLVPGYRGFPDLHDPQRKTDG